MPIVVVCEGCEARYTLKDEFAGRKVKCKSCGSVIVAPESDEYADERPDRGYHPAFDRDRFLLNQQRISISEKYYVYGEESKDRPILFITRPAHLLKNLVAAFAAFLTLLLVVGMFLAAGLYLSESMEQKAIGGLLILAGFVLGIVATIYVGIRLSPKRHIYVYSDDSMSELLLEILQDQKVAIINATYTVRDPEEGEIGRFRKNYLYNFFRKKWEAEAADGTPVVTVREDSMILSLMRRLLGPMLGLLRTNFVIFRPGTEQVIGEFNRKATLFDRYVLDLSADRGHELDRRMAIALGVLLDTGERR